jgi:hypothetical protein
VRVKWPIIGAAIVGLFAVISYSNSMPTPETGVVVGIIAVTTLVILAVVLLDRFAAGRARAKP